MSVLIIFLQVLLLLSFNEQQQQVAAKSNFELFFNNISCTKRDTKNVLTKLSCYVSKSVKRRTFSLELKFSKDIRHFTFDLLFVLPRKSGDFVLLNLTNVNGCNLLSNKNQVTFIELGRATLDRFSNFPKGCPFQKNVLYFIRGFRLDLSTMPAFNIETDTNMWFDFIYEREKLYSAFISSRILRRQGTGANKGFPKIF